MRNTTNSPADDAPLTLAQGAKEILKRYGKKPDISTLWRWCTKGVAGCRLQSLVVAGRTYVTRAGLEQFFREVAEARAARYAPQPISADRRSRSEVQRAAAVEKARRKLEAAGV